MLQGHLPKRSVSGGTKNHNPKDFVLSTDTQVPSGRFPLTSGLIFSRKEPVFPKLQLNPIQN